MEELILPIYLHGIACPEITLPSSTVGLKLFSFQEMANNEVWYASLI